MAKTGAERQAAYRARHAVEESGQRRISTWISTEAALALEVLADRYGVTMREVIEILLLRDQQNPANHQIKKDFSSTIKSRRKRVLPSNEPFQIASIGSLPVGGLPGNDAGIAAGGDAKPFLHNGEGTKISPETNATPEPPRGGQYSLEL